jgi:hypothetical protein
MPPSELWRDVARSLYPVPHGWKPVLSAAALIGFYLLATMVYGRPRAGPLFVDLIDLALGGLAIMAAFSAAFRSHRLLANRFWILMACAWILWAVAQVMGAYHDIVLQKSITESYDSDAILFIFMAPMAMALLLDPSSEGTEFDWQTGLDFLQIGILSVLAYKLYDAYLFHSSGVTAYSTWVAQTLRLTVLVIAYFVRAAWTRSPMVRALFARMGA